MPHALQFLILTVSGWVNRQQQEFIEYQRAEIRVLLEQLGGKRLRLTDDQRRRLAVHGKRIGRKGLRLQNDVDGFRTCAVRGPVSDYHGAGVSPSFRRAMRDFKEAHR